MAVLVALGLLIPTSLRAQPRSSRAPLRLTYERSAGAERCPAEGAVLQVFREQLGGRAAGLSLRLAVAGREGGAGSAREIAGRLELLDGAGHRTWAHELPARSDDCAALLASLAVSLRIALNTPSESPAPGASPGDPAAAAIPPGGLPPRPPEAEAPPDGISQHPVVIRGEPAKSNAPPLPVEDPAPRSAPVRRPASPEAPRYRSWASIAVVTGAAPAGAARWSLGLAFEWPAVSLGLEARVVPPVTGDLTAHRLEVARFEGTFVPCLAEAVFHVCGLLSVGGTWTELSGAREERRSLIRASGGARAGAELVVSSRLSLFAHVDMEGSFWPVLVHLKGGAPWREAAGQIALGFAVIGTFPDTRP